MDKNLGRLDLHDYKPLREIVFSHLRESIMVGKLKPGERLMEVQLAENLGVSRTPVREAIRKLELEGLVVMVPRKGAYVSEVSISDIKDVLEIRVSLEGLAASLASERIKESEIDSLQNKFNELKKAIESGDIQDIIDKDTELHDIIFNATRNKRLISLVDSLREQVQRFRVTYMHSNNESANLIEEHKKILDAIKNRNKNKAKEYAEEHIRKAKDYIVENFNEKIN